jgi:hypothetical protein
VQPGVPNLDIIDTTNERDGYIAITNLSSDGELHNLLLDKYVEKYSTKEEVGELKEVVGQISNENNSFIQKGNEAIGENSASFGASNINFSDYSFTEGLMNIAGAKLNNLINAYLRTAVLVTKIVNGRTISAARINTDPYGYENIIQAFEPGDIVIIVANNTYYSCRFIEAECIEVDEESAEPNYFIYLENHNVISGINNAPNEYTEMYKVGEENSAESCHTEHIEGAYNISAETGDGAKSSRVSHIEGHTNISFGQYNHIEGVQNKALNQTEFTHIEGRMNTVDGGEGKNDKVSASHVRGRSNTLVNSN